MADQLIPLTNSPQQSFEVPLAIDGKTVRLRLDITYNEMANYWILKVTNDQGVVLLDSVPLVTGDWPASNILQQFAYLGIGSAYMINASQLALDFPDQNTLGSDFILVWSDTAT